MCWKYSYTLLGYYVPVMQDLFDLNTYNLDMETEGLGAEMIRR